MSIDRETAERRLRGLWRSDGDEYIPADNPAMSAFVTLHLDDCMRLDMCAGYECLSPEFIRAHALALAEVQRMVIP